MRKVRKHGRAETEIKLFYNLSLQIALARGLLSLPVARKLLMVQAFAGAVTNEFPDLRLRSG